MTLFLKRHRIASPLTQTSGCYVKSALKAVQLAPVARSDQTEALVLLNGLREALF